MAKLFRHSICGHKNIYADNNNNRELVIEYGEPDNGANNDTGILITVPGYGGDINSNVYRKMRKTLPDKYNMIVMQCDYFGNKYMHSDLPQELEKLLHYENLKQCKLVWKSKPEDMGESVEEFNDMGIMQALDIVNATLEIITLYLRNGYEINLNKIVLLGHSHGGYISHLANIICPDLFSFIIDISSYLLPYYLKNDRYIVSIVDGNKKIEWFIEPFLKMNCNYSYCNNLYNLKYLYKFHSNRCKIIAIQGTEDWMVPVLEKKEFISGIENAEIVLITPEMVDGKLFKHADHGLGTDYFELINVFFPMIEAGLERKTEIDIEAIVNINNELIISYDGGVPELKYIERCS